MTNSNSIETFNEMTARLRAEREAYEEAEQADYDAKQGEREAYQQYLADEEDERRDLQTQEKYTWVIGGTVQWI